MEKCVEDVRQEEKDVPDLLEAIMRPTCLVEGELQQILFKMNQFRSKITKIRVSTFWFRKSDGFPPEANASLLATRFQAIFGCASGQIFEKMWVLARQGL